MSDEMANGQFDPVAANARLWERVENQGKDIIDLRSNMNTGFQNLQAGISQLTNELRNATKTQWPVVWSAVGVCFTVLATLTGFFYMSLKAEQTRFDTALLRLSDTVVTQDQLDWRSERGKEDRVRNEAAFADIREQLVPRSEYEITLRDVKDRLARLEAKTFQ